MEKNEFKKLLFKVGFCAMACDGDIDESEINEMKMMDKNTSFFHDIDLSEELSELISELDKKGVQIINDLFKILKNNILNSIQELIILEVALRIINADNKHDENEIKFIHYLRANLKLHDEEIVDRFGEIDILHTNSHIKNVVKRQNDKGFAENLTLPEVKEIKKINFNLK
jgi:uncharacterized tellurite resistance protein B-like protein